MAFDLSAVITQANDAVIGPSTYKYKIYYPGMGTSKLKLLFNPASNSVARLIRRHTIDDSKVPCLRTYGQECPLCQALDTIADAGGPDLYRYNAKARGVSFAHFIEYQPAPGSASNPRGPQPGEIVVFMYPWTVYKQIMTMIDQYKNAPQNLEKLMATNEGYACTVTHTDDNKYDIRVDPFNMYKTRGSDAEFEQFLRDLENLNEQVLPSQPTNEMIQDVRELAGELTAKFLKRSVSTAVPNRTQNQVPQPVSNQHSSQTSAPQQPSGPVPSTPVQPPIQTTQATQPVQPTQQAQPAQFVNQPSSPNPPTDRPPCFGSHDTQTDQNKCLLCPLELECMESSNRQAF